MLTPLTTDDPRRIGPYRLANRIGAGGMGTVYLGFTEDGSPVAVKVPSAGLADNPEFRSRFRHEVDAARRVRGSAVAAVLDADLTADRPWMATEYVEGKSLADAVASRGELDDRLVQGLAVGLADALVAIHAAGVVHRDLKPSNILLAWDGPKVIDFGIARAADNTSHTRTGTLIGTLVWMAPEQLRGERAGPAADIFAWGACVAFAAAGRPPFRGERAEAVGMQILTAQPDLDDLPAALVGIVRAALDKEPARRPRATDLLAHLVGHEVHSPAESDQASETALARWWSLPPTPPEGAGPQGGYRDASYPARPRPGRPPTGPPAGPGYGAGQYGRDSSGYPGGGNDRYQRPGHDPGRGSRGAPAGAGAGLAGRGADGWDPTVAAGGQRGPDGRDGPGGARRSRSAVVAVAALLAVLLGGGIAAGVVLTSDGDTTIGAEPTASSEPTSPPDPASPAPSSPAGQSPSASPTPSSSTPTRTAAPTISAADAAEMVRQQGYEPNMSTYAAGRSLNVVIGEGPPLGDNPQQLAFVFADGEYQGTDTKVPSVKITVQSPLSEREIVLRYATFAPEDSSATPSGHADVRFRWDGSRFTPLDEIPPSDANAPASRR